MHSLGVAHRDIKPDNLVFTGGDRTLIKIVDFGFAASWKADSGAKRLRTVLGTPAYMAPELVKKQPYLGPPVDVWALGTVSLSGAAHSATCAWTWSCTLLVATCGCLSGPFFSPAVTHHPITPCVAAPLRNDPQSDGFPW